MSADDSWETRYLQQPHAVKWVAPEHSSVAMCLAGGHSTYPLAGTVLWWWPSAPLPWAQLQPAHGWRLGDQCRSPVQGTKTTMRVSGWTRGRETEVGFYHKYPMDVKVRWMSRCRSKVQNQKGWEETSYDQQREHAPVPLTPSFDCVTHAGSLTAVFGCLLLYWVYISGYLSIKQYHLIYWFQKINFLWCLKVTEEYCQQGSCSFSQTLQAQSVASGKPETHTVCLTKAAGCRTIEQKPIQCFLFRHTLLPGNILYVAQDSNGVAIRHSFLSSGFFLLTIFGFTRNGRGIE